MKRFLRSLIRHALGAAGLHQVAALERRPSTAEGLLRGLAAERVDTGFQGAAEEVVRRGRKGRADLDAALLAYLHTDHRGRALGPEIAPAGGQS